MADPFLAEIRMFGGNFAPTGWATCSGQLLPISQNTALFSLLGTNYGGNGQTTFALPNLQGNIPVGPGQGPGLSSYNLGQTGGTQNVTLTSNQLPNHGHSVQASVRPAESTSPASQGLARSASNAFVGGAANTALSPSSTTPNGGDQPHNNLQPYLVVTFIIALQGIYPQRP